MSGRPPPGTMVWWRFKARAPCPYRFGYCTYPPRGHDMVRMGAYNGDSHGGAMVEVSEIEWKEYR